MNRFKSFSVALILCSLASFACAAAAPPSRDVNEDALNAVGIISPSVATSVIAIDYFIHFRDTGEFGICADGQDSHTCADKKYLTPEQYVAKFYPKAKYVGFRLFVNGSGSDTWLHIFIKKLPQ